MSIDLDVFLADKDMTERPPTTASLHGNACRFGNGKPRVSVIISRGRRDNPYWQECLQSVASQQGLSAWELLAIEDYDHLATIGEARNIAASMSTAPYLFFLDDDDILLSDCLRRALNCAVKSGAAMVNINAMAIDTKSNPMPMKSMYTLGLVRREAFNMAGKFKRLSMYEDIDLMVRFDVAGFERALAENILYAYRHHEGMTSKSQHSDALAWAKSNGYETEVTT